MKKLIIIGLLLAACSQPVEVIEETEAIDSTIVDTVVVDTVQIDTNAITTN